VDRIEEIVRVHVKLFATLGTLMPGTAPGTQFEVELPARATLSTLVSHLGLPVDEVRLAFVNGRARPMDWVLNPDDEVGLFPPVGGG
jgi:molybdopterin synthase sulfur carrier subunit